MHGDELRCGLGQDQGRLGEGTSHSHAQDTRHQWCGEGRDDYDQGGVGWCGHQLIMALTLNKEDGTGKPTANTYALVADADSYHEGHLYAAGWTAATVEQKTAALVMATRVIDSEYQFNGYRAGCGRLEIAVYLQTHQPVSDCPQL